MPKKIRTPMTAKEYSKLQDDLNNAEDSSAALDTLADALDDTVRDISGKAGKQAKALLAIVRKEKKIANSKYNKLVRAMDREDIIRRANGFCPACGRKAAK